MQNKNTNDTRYQTIVDPEALRALQQDGAQIVEVLSKEQYENVHIAGAISIPLISMNRETVRVLQPDQPVIVYCYDFQ